jgi:hypothetical protein
VHLRGSLWHDDVRNHWFWVPVMTAVVDVSDRLTEFSKRIIKNLKDSDFAFSVEEDELGIWDVYRYEHPQLRGVGTIALRLSMHTEEPRVEVGVISASEMDYEDVLQRLQELLLRS